MSGDLRAKKNSRFSNKTGGNKKENPKGALDLQPYGLNDGEVDLSKEFSTVTSTEEGYEDISEDRIITTKPIRKTKRRELNKYKQQGRHHRQQTPPPPSYYNLDEDVCNDEYGRVTDLRSKICRVLGGFVILSLILGACVVVVRNDGHLKIIGGSESFKTILPSTIVLPDFQDFQNHLNMETANTIASNVRDISFKGWSITLEILHQLSISSKETCSNIMNFVETITKEIKIGEIFKDASYQLETSNDPNDDSQDYTPELNEWIESTENQKEAVEEESEEKDTVQDVGNSEELIDDSIRSKELTGSTESIEISAKDHIQPAETIVVTSFPDTQVDSSIKPDHTLEPEMMDDKVVEEPVIEKTTAPTLG